MARQSSSAEAFFNRVTTSADPVSFLRGLVDPTAPTFEEEWLDFKGGARLDDKTVRETWSKGLSGFANAGGGVLVWGIDARKDPATNVDAANGFNLVSDPAVFKSRLLELHQFSTDPPVAGVEIRYYPDPNEGGSGFVVCLVPESPFRPHRAEHVKNKPYYIRAGDDFVIPSPALLRCLFFPHTHSHLWVEVAVDWEASRPLDEWGNTVEQARIDFKVRIHNSGTATANEVYVVVQSDCRMSSVYAHGDWRKTENPQGQFALEAKRPLHPGAVSPLFDCSVDAGVTTLTDISGITPIPNRDRAELRFLMYAADREPQVAAVRFDQDEILRRASKKGSSETADWHRMLP